MKDGINTPKRQKVSDMPTAQPTVEPHFPAPVQNPQFCNLHADLFAWMAQKYLPAFRFVTMNGTKSLHSVCKSWNELFKRDAFKKMKTTQAVNESFKTFTLQTCKTSDDVLNVLSDRNGLDCLNFSSDDLFTIGSLNDDLINIIVSDDKYYEHLKRALPNLDGDVIARFGRKHPELALEIMNKDMLWKRIKDESLQALIFLIFQIEEFKTQFMKKVNTCPELERKLSTLPTDLIKTKWNNVWYFRPIHIYKTNKMLNSANLIADIPLKEKLHEAAKNILAVRYAQLAIEQAAQHSKYLR